MAEQTDTEAGAVKAFAWRWQQALIGLAVGVALLALTMRRAPIGDILASLRAIDFGWAAIALLAYAIDLGIPPPNRFTAFSRDPEIKTETIWNGPILRPATLLVDRHDNVVRTRGEDGEWLVISYQLPTFDSMLAQFADPRNAPEMLA